MPPIFRKAATMAMIIVPMTGVMTSVMTWLNLAEGQTFLAAWLPTWARAALFLAPLGIGIMALVGKLIDVALPKAGKAVQSLFQTGTMILFMMSLMATITTVQLHGWAVGFADVWIGTMLSGLPVALVMGTLMTFVIKPRMEAAMAA